MKVSYLGPAGTFSQMAALRAAQLLEIKDPEYIAYGTIAETALAIVDKVDYAVIPRENLIEGDVTMALDVLPKLPDNVSIIKEILVPIEQNLAVAPAHKDEPITTVYSHTQATAQCTDHLKKLDPHLDIQPTESTAAAAVKVSNLNSPGVAAVCSRAAAEINGLRIIAENIADDKNNQTRFIVLSKKPLEFKTMIAFTVPHETGGLNKILTVFTKEGINLETLPQRPYKVGDEPLIAGKRMFFAEFNGYAKDENIAYALENVRLRVEYLKILGSYPILN